MKRFLLALAPLSLDAFLIHTTTTMRPAARATVVHMSEEMPNFYAVYHTFPDDIAEEWWGAVANADFDAMSKEQHEAGIFNHFFMPAAVEGPILCLWECKDKTLDSSAFKEFIDGPTSPAAPLNNLVLPINPVGMTPASAWPTKPAPAAASAGSFFWVHHTFNKGKAAAFWEQMGSTDMAEFDASMIAKGFKNHLFMPTTDPNVVICVWESAAPMDVSDFQEFIDGADGPSPGTFVNKVYPVMEGGTHPPAAFPKSWLDETMAKIEAILPFKLDDIVAKLKEMQAKA